MSYAGLLTLAGELGIATAGTVDDYGDPVEVYTWHPTRCHLARSTSSESAENVTADTMTVYLDAEVLELPGLDASARLRAAGNEWEFAGELIVARNPRSHTVTVSADVRKAGVA